MRGRHRIPGAILALIVLALPPLRTWMEAHMALHMLVQFPLLLLMGAWAGGAWQPSSAQVAGDWNRHGIAGLLLVSMTLAFWMVPRSLDLVLDSSTLEVAKFASLLLAGAAWAQSWRSAGLLVRGFFLGNLLPMTAVTGWLYAASPVRLCNAYLTSQQEMAGQGLMLLSLFAALYWLLTFFAGGVAPAQTHLFDPEHV